MSEQPEAASAGSAAADIIAKFGGQAELMRELQRAGHTISQQTISKWTRSCVPEKWRPILIAIAAKEGIPHRPLDYVAYLMPFAA